MGAKNTTQNVAQFSSEGGGNYSKQPLARYVKNLESGTFPPVVYSNVLSTFTCNGRTVKEDKIESRKKTVRKEAL